MLSAVRREPDMRFRDELIKTAGQVLRPIGILVTLAICLAVNRPALAAVVHTEDFIPDAERTQFNGFEGATTTYYLNAYYVEDGIEVAQVNPDEHGILSTFFSEACSAWLPPEGMRSWWPNGGDHGYTQIRRQDGSDFFEVGLVRGTGHCPSTIFAFELLKDGQLVLNGTLPHSEGPKYVGFSGGGFDEIRIRDAYPPEWAGNFYDGGYNVLAVDAIELRDLTTPVRSISWGRLRIAYR